MRIGIYQFNPNWGEKSNNLDKISTKIKQDNSVDLWILPELITTGYQFTSQAEVAELAEKFPGGKTDQQLRHLTKNETTAVIIGVVEKYQDKFYNSAAVYDKGEFLGIYRKIHLFYKEKDFFSKGYEAPKVVEINGAKVGIMICFDWIFPEIARSLALKGAQLIAHPANLVLPYCQAAMVTRSIENHIVTATANRIGDENRDGEKLTFTGMSQITDVTGKRVAQLGKDEEKSLIHDIDLTAADNKAITNRNHLFDDRRPELYYLKETHG